MRLAGGSYAARLLTLFAVVPIAGACNGDGTTAPLVPAQLVGTWDATSLSAGGIDLLAAGYGLSLTFTGDGGYGILITGDNPANPLFCDDPPAASCSDSGDFTATGSQITLNPGTVDQTVLSYTVSGSTLTVTTTIDGIMLQATFDKA